MKEEAQGKAREMGSTSGSASEKLSPQDVAHMEEALRRHYGEPVRPVSAYCNAFTLWRRAIIDALKRGDYRDEVAEGWEKIVLALNEIELPIRKSNLLWRLIYLGEPLRTEKCPDHEGHWVGCWFDGRSCECQSGYDVTGWLPQTEAPCGPESISQSSSEPE